MDELWGGGPDPGPVDPPLSTPLAANNGVNNCKPDHNHSKLLCHWLVKDK
jgi:hypothetical protein